VIFFGLFFGICDYIFTTFVPPGTVNVNNGQLAMSKGSALAAMLWAAIVVYTIDRRWIKAAMFCVVTAVFAGMGLIHQAAAVGTFVDGTGGNLKSTSPFEFMMGYLSLAAVCGLYWFLQTYSGKKLGPDEEGYEDDHGYLPPIEEEGVDNLFETWWEPAERDMPVPNKQLDTTDKLSSDEMGGKASDEVEVMEA
jgi:hypothetical protein